MPTLTLPLSLPALVLAGYLVSLATVVIPGPITLVAPRLALAHRLLAAAWFLFGATALDAILFAALAAGAGPILARLGALPVVEIAGGLVLLWGAVASKKLKQPQPEAPGPENRIVGGFSHYFLLGMGVSLANPHSWLWCNGWGSLWGGGPSLRRTWAFVDAGGPYCRGGELVLAAALGFTPRKDTSVSQGRSAGYPHLIRSSPAARPGPGGPGQLPVGRGPYAAKSHLWGWRAGEHLGLHEDPEQLPI